MVIASTPHNTKTWKVIQHLDKPSSTDLENQRLKNNENTGWGPLDVQAMCDETRGIAIPGGSGDMTLGDLMDLTPKELMSKVMLEEKVFETWYNGRTVLLGDGKRLAGMVVEGRCAFARYFHRAKSKTASDPLTNIVFL